MVNWNGKQQRWDKTDMGRPNMVDGAAIGKGDLHRTGKDEVIALRLGERECGVQLKRDVL